MRAEGVDNCAIDSPWRVALDMDSTEVPVYGRQEQSAYNGHLESTDGRNNDKLPLDLGTLKRRLHDGKFLVDTDKGRQVLTV